MTNVLVCIKRVPDAAGEVTLTADGQAVDARFVGFTSARTRTAPSSWPCGSPATPAARRPC
jgi:electron transfer flavoprotein beta subunit